MEKTVQTISAIKNKYETDLMRVGAYCRVSTDSEDQANSFFTQTMYYHDYIKNNDQMTLVDIYADEGISGTSINKRDEFQRMIKDAQNGMLDRILVKSITRFARNSLECIESVRLLKSCGVSVYFENDRIDTSKMSSETMLYIKSAFAQNESLSHSRRIKTSIEMKMKEGEYCPTFAPYGYKYENKEITIVPKEAENVKKIYELYLSGMGMHAIVKYMQLHETGNTEWGMGKIEYILSNERYIGDYMMKKTYTPEQFPLRNRPNKGQEEKYYFEGANEAIISKEDFLNVQKIKATREAKFTKGKTGTKKFDYKLKCKKCGWAYRIKHYREKEYYACSKKGLSLDVCHAPNLTEEEIQNAFIKMYNILKFNQKILLEDTITQLQQLKILSGNNNASVADIDSEIATMTEKNISYENMYASNIITEVFYQEKTNEIRNKLRSLRYRRQKLIEEDVEELCLDNLRKLKVILESNPKILTKFDKKIYQEIIKEGKVEQNGDIEFVLLGDLECKIRRKDYEK